MGGQVSHSPIAHMRRDTVEARVAPLPLKSVARAGDGCVCKRTSATPTWLVGTLRETAINPAARVSTAS